MTWHFSAALKGSRAIISFGSSSRLSYRYPSRGLSLLNAAASVQRSCRTSASLGLRTCGFQNLSPAPRLLDQAAIKATQLQADLLNTMASAATVVAGGDSQETGGGKFKYPTVRRDESTTYTSYGVQVVDAYRWLEDADSEETKKFVEAQNAITDPYIKSCPHRGAIISRLRDLFEYPRYGCPFKEGPNYYMNVNSGLQNQAVMYIMRGSLDAKQEVFLDPNTLSKDGTVSMSSYTCEFSKDGKWFAYGLNTSGSDWNSLRIKNVDTGNDLPEVLTRLKFSNITWTHDNRGFFYSAFPGIEGDGTETTECTYQKLYYHRIGTPQTEDVLVYERPDEPNYRFNASISDCGHYLHVWTNHSCEYNLWHYHRFEDPLAPVITGPLALETVVDVFNADYYYVANDGPRTVFRTNLHASNFRLCVVDLSDVAAARLPASWTDLVPEHPKDVLEGAVAAAGDLIVASYIRDVTSRVQLHRLSDGSLLRELPLPLGNVTGLAAKREQKELFYSFTSFLIPGIVYHLVLEGEGVTGAKEPTVFREAKPANFDHTKFVTEQVFYESKDGTKVPMFLVHKKDFTKDGQAPCRLYAYGGFNVSIKPSFSLQNIILMENLGGLFALANIRGGGEYGEKWHNAAKLEKKQTCFDDFIAAAEYLTKERYTRSEKLWIEGGSNGGLLIGAVSNQRPELFAAGIAHVGVMDLLRFHKFTIGHAWMSEYGNPEKEADFRNLIRLSPLHNVPGDVDRFPATLLLTADHDDRVVPLHSFKLIAELQHKLGEKVGARTPLLARIDTKSGHGFGKPTEKIIEEVADIYSFIINALKLEYKQQQ